MAGDGEQEKRHLTGLGKQHVYTPRMGYDILLLSNKNDLRQAHLDMHGTRVSAMEVAERVGPLRPQVLDDGSVYFQELRGWAEVVRRPSPAAYGPAALSPCLGGACTQVSLEPGFWLARTAIGWVMQCKERQTSSGRLVSSPDEEVFSCSDSSTKEGCRSLCCCMHSASVSRVDRREKNGRIKLPTGTNGKGAAATATEPHPIFWLPFFYSNCLLVLLCCIVSAPGAFAAH
ncbi:hypothetical protein QBC44DRAFT_84821 [Cladorrhinum sp. PSN332]|nr:hypothetical protein QBC44DRAFT_84821 [Cladorrhinum sp. PSN332]